MRIPRIVANLMLAVAVFSAVARAQVVLTDDSFTSSLSPKTNYGTSIVLIVSSGTNTYLKFSLPSGINGNSISGANVVLYVDAVLTAGTTDVYAVNGSWTQGSITYNNAPPLGSQILSAVPVTKAGYLSLNLTSTVQAWLNGSLANNGIVLVRTPGSPISVSFDSLENVFTSHPAQLSLVLVSAGPQGPQGVEGPVGPQGPTGATGATGLTGPQGPQGLTGAMGLMGPAGQQGPAGPMGPMGLTGPQGPQGVQGPAGTNGVGFNFTGPFKNSTSYNVNDVATYNGSTYVALVASQGAGTPDIDTTDWSLMAQQGATGPAGATGPQGAVGNPGPQGPTGAVGPQGPAGPMGPMGLTGPQGPQGVQGPAGPGNTVTQVSNTAAGCDPGLVACQQDVTATCPSGTAIVGCTAYESQFCADGSVGVIGTFISGNSCTAIAINHSPGGRCGTFVSNATTTAQCLNVPWQSFAQGVLTRVEGIWVSQRFWLGSKREPQKRRSIRQAAFLLHHAEGGAL
jgi:hypothetical protein